MIYTVKLDKKNNYILNTITGETVDKFDPDNENLSVIITLNDNKQITVKSSDIVQEYGGQYTFQHLEDKYIIDDEYQSSLIQAGYIVYKNYGKERISDSKLGNEIRENIMLSIRKAVPKLGITCSMQVDGNTIITEIEHNNYHYTVRFETVNSIVNRNYKRKANSLTYYPFEKSMDKYGTVYMSIFANKLREADESSKFKLPNILTSNLMKELGSEYYFELLPIKGRIIYCTGV